MFWFSDLDTLSLIFSFPLYMNEKETISCSSSDFYHFVYSSLDLTIDTSREKMNLFSRSQFLCIALLKMAFSQDEDEPEPLIPESVEHESKRKTRPRCSAVPPKPRKVYLKRAKC